ncbi:MAG: M20/M25/M40 family metallo-hydrolase [Bacteroidales bacterium]
MKFYKYCAALFVIISQTALPQSPEILTIRKYTHKNTHSILREFSQFLSLPNNAKDSADIRQNAEFLRKMMIDKGISNVQLLETDLKNSPPVVYGEVRVPGAVTTIMFYAHYDGQPVNPAQWTHGLDPFKPEIFSDAITNNGTRLSMTLFPEINDNYRIYARSASDDKAGVCAILNAYEAILHSELKPSCNVKFFFEGEEEAGSPHLKEMLEKYSDLLSSDLWIICDGPIHQTGKKQVFFGVRGVTGLDITVYGPKRPLHSGHYGNWAPNPAMMLSKLLSSMKDDDGKVLIKGFYDDVVPLSPFEKDALRQVPQVDDILKDELGTIDTEIKGITLSEAITQPSLNIKGIQSGNTGALASNQIPSYARADLDLRIVQGNDYLKQQHKVVEHIKSQGYYITKNEPTDAERKKYNKIARISTQDQGYNAQRTSMDLPISRKVIQAVRSTTSDPLILQPTMGASLPLIVIETATKAKIISIPIVNHDNNQHAENENLRLRDFFNGIETLAALMMIK